MPGHVIRNDATSGESWVATGAGVLAIQEASHDPDGQIFAPGFRWRSIRLRLGVDVGDELFRLVRLLQAGSESAWS